MSNNFNFFVSARLTTVVWLSDDMMMRGIVWLWWWWWRKKNNKTHEIYTNARILSLFLFFTIAHDFDANFGRFFVLFSTLFTIILMIFLSAIQVPPSSSFGWRVMSTQIRINVWVRSECVQYTKCQNLNERGILKKKCTFDPI